jgi:3'-phosphoadenosine 5'-phosphosulfate sulfotransferase (PAPS reductase)/FAD synthetase
MVPDRITLHDYQWVVINSSAGKDSQVMLEEVVRQADDELYPRDQLVVVHADLGEVEWPGTKELAQEQAEHYGLRFVVEKRNGDDLLEYARRRGKWPSNQQRWCTSDFKRGPVSRLYTRLVAESRVKDPERYHRRAKQAYRMGKTKLGNDRKVYYGPKEYTTEKVQILNCFGFRAQESPARKKKEEIYVEDGRQSPFRNVITWLPVHKMLVDEVWRRIKASGVRHHWAYDRGMTRLSCRFCIFAPKGQLRLAAEQPENKELFQKYLAVEREIDHTFQSGHSLQDVADAIACGTEVEEDDGSWNM